MFGFGFDCNHGGSEGVGREGGSARVGGGRERVVGGSEGVVRERGSMWERGSVVTWSVLRWMSSGSVSGPPPPLSPRALSHSKRVWGTLAPVAFGFF